MKKTFILVLLLLCTVLVVRTEEINYVSFSELKEQAKEGWHKSYTVKGRDIEVNVDNINVVDIETKTLPIPLIRAQEKVDLSNIPHSKIEWEDAEGVFITRYSNYKENISPEKSVQFDFIKSSKEEDLQAEDNPMSLAEAEEVGKEILNSVMLQFPNTSLGIEERNATTKFYADPSREIHMPFMPKKEYEYTSFGNYWLAYHQIFNGIPCLSADRDFFALRLVSNIPFGEAGVDIATREDYCMRIRLAKYQENYVEDIPIADFSSLLRALDALMKEGYLFEVNKLELRYGIADNQDGDGSTCMLIPIWLIYGKGVQYADMPFPKTVEEYPSAFDIQRRFAIHAQTLQVYGHDVKNKDNSVIPVLTWEDVK